MQAPTQCVLWHEPDRIQTGLRDLLDLVETYLDDSHWSRSLLRCRECGQLYFYEFYEVVDWEGGDDASYSTLIPLADANAAEALKTTSPVELLQFVPRLQWDYPREAKAASVRWIGKD